MITLLQQELCFVFLISCRHWIDGLLFFLGTTILDAIRESVGDKTEVIYDQYPSPNFLARQNFSFAIVVVGEPTYAESLGDDEELVIPFNGSELVSSVALGYRALVFGKSRWSDCCLVAWN